MARRLFNGRAFSENGWPYVDQGSCTWVTVPGTNVTLQIQNGWPLSILRAFAADFNACVEPLRDPDSACWTEGNSVATSNHPGGTAMDLNWDGPDGKTFRFDISEERAYPGDKAQKLRELLDFYEGMIFCGGDWSIRDWMHFQINGGTYDNPRTGDFIARKIRADGFSTFRRGNAPVSAAPILAAATGLSEARAAEILAPVRDGLTQADCTNVNRIAMWLAQVGHESGSFVYTEEIASGSAYEGRANLGNTQPGDGVRFKGRSWIQITGRNNYGAFSRWANSRGLVPSPTHFVDNPTELAELKWAGVGAAWYWTVARADINSLSDNRDLDSVTRRINGGTNGIDDRRNRYNRALAQGDALLQILNGDEDELADPALVKKINEIHACLFNTVVSTSPYRDPKNSDGSEPDSNTWQIHELIKNDDGMYHMKYVEDSARDGDPAELARVIRAAQGLGAVRTPDFINRARRVLNEIEATKPEILQTYLAQNGTQA